MTIYAVIKPLNPASGLRETVRLSSGAARGKSVYAGNKYWPAINKLPQIGLNVFDGDFSTAIKPGSCSFDISLVSMADEYPNASDYRWPGSDISLTYVDDKGNAQEIFVGKVSRFGEKSGILGLSAEVDVEPFKADVLSYVYAGTTGIEGGSDIKGKPKPLVIGRALNVSPVQIDTVDNVFQVSSYGPVQAIQAIYERGASFGASIGNYADYAALIAADIPEGRWGTCHANGLFRLGAPPYGVITADVDGLVHGGTWIRKTGQIIKALVAMAGISSSLVDTNSFNDLDIAVPFNINAVISGQIDVLSIAQRLAIACNAQAGINLFGQLFVTRLNTDSPAIILNSEGRNLPAVMDIAELSTRPPYKRIIMGANRSWRVHSFDEIATYAPLIDRGVYSPTETYREGNIVFWSKSDGGTGSSYVHSWSSPTIDLAPSDTGIWSTLVETGADGSNGLNNSRIFIYKRSVAAPAMPSATTTYTFATGALTGLNNGWTLTIPAGSDPLYVSVATASSAGATDTIAAAEWSGATILAQNGADGSNGSAGPAGLNSATIFLYRRSASAPAVPTGTLTYTFSTGILASITGGWTQTVPAGTDPVYITTATAASTAATDTIGTGEWAAPKILARDGTDGAPGVPGADGTTTYTWIAYAWDEAGAQGFTTGSPDGRAFQGIATNKTTATESTNPADYTWSQYAGPASFGLVPHEGVIVGPDYILKTGASGWNASAYSSESFTGGCAVSFEALATNHAYMIGINTDPTTDSNYTSIDYSLYLTATATAQLRVNGTSVATLGSYAVGDVFQLVYNGQDVKVIQNGVVVHTRTAGVTAGQTYFLDCSITTPSARIAKIKWIGIGPAGADGADGSNGANGIDGLNSAVVFIYQRKATVPALPTATSTYTFATGGITGLNNGWTAAVPAGTLPLYVTTATATGTGTTDTILAAEWASTVVLAQNGSDGSTGSAGSPGLNSATVFLYQRKSTVPVKPSVTSTYTFATGVLTGHNNGWVQTIPSGTLPIYVTTASALGSGSTDTIAAAEWAAVTVLAQNGADGSNGSNGAAGADSFVVTADVPAVALPATAAGAVKSGLPRTITMKAMLAAANVTGSTTFSTPTLDNCAVVKATANTYRIDAVSDIRASFSFTATYGTYSQVLSIPIAVLLDGDAATQMRDNSITNTTSGSFVAVSSELTLNVTAGADITASASFLYSISGAPTSGSQGRKRMRVMYQNFSDGGAWTQMGAEMVGSYAKAAYFIYPTEPNHTTGSAGGTRTLTGPASTKVYKFRLEMLHEGTALNGGGNFVVNLS